MQESELPLPSPLDSVLAGCTCGRPDGKCSCGPADSLSRFGYVFVLGRVEPHFPTLGIEKEYLQARKPAASADKSDREILYDTLTEQTNRYLARKMCWVLSVAG